MAIEADIGLIGLGVMGANLALNIAENGYPIAVFNRTAEKLRVFADSAGPLGERIIRAGTLAELVAAIRPPRAIILMVQAGEAVDQQLEQLQPLLAPGDLIIDAGNANFRDTIRRARALDEAGLSFLGLGVSGGEEGARYGPSLMAGGTEASYARVEGILDAIAAKYNGEACCARLGPDGAGHFVKTIHNGIEYADMQMIAEIYGLMRDGAGMSAGEIATQFRRWNDGPLRSYLIEITAKVLETRDPGSETPVTDLILDRAGQKGTGRWSVIEAQVMGVPATAIEAAVAARSLSALKTEREFAAAAYGSLGSSSALERASFVATAEMALLAGKVTAYAQGFAVIAAASAQFGWNLPLPAIARIWRAGCIIRSDLLDTIASAFEAEKEAPNLLVVPAFVRIMQKAVPQLRAVVSDAVGSGLPVPSLAAALSHFEAYRQSRGTANLIQAQRDFFGAHGFDRTDTAGVHHGPWGLAVSSVSPAAMLDGPTRSSPANSGPVEE
ncbi:6-phosphogluconate dehydrogenase, decarboxylating [Mesorhizobium sp. L-8-10]|uniref:NADP-dependent phosphogluconate dehydrogenase n=1 Tax=Mesorhizobium sp. L-8-10 TaxID=2744523 RepID=UPI0019285835|nr:NADP-dependent phosphogluconate dehydrogenase [Mesorhizobium sp. L-8-10]BCH35184.1 6-phosphogluconate dehydrogenase, decarboxylating [Mesorhizobium sp. L-8-10]